MTQTTYLGLDVHSRTIAIARLYPGSNEPAMSEIANDPTVVRKAFQREKQRSGGSLRCCYEAGPCGYVLQRQLAELGIPCEVVAPSLIPRKPGERVKTDSRDAAKLARLYRAGDLTTIGVPTEEQEAGRDLVRARDDARKDRVAARHRLTKFLLRHGYRFAEGHNWTAKFWAWVKKIAFARAGEQIAFDHYVDQVNHLDHRIDVLDTAIEQLAQSESYRDMVGKLTCLRGISTLGAMIIITEVYDLRRFASARQLMAFLGLVPSEHSSGQKQRRGGITKTGNGHVRRMLVEAAWSYRHQAIAPTVRQKKAFAAQPPGVVDIARKASHRLGKRYRHLSSRNKKWPAVTVAVAREMCGFLWALGQVS